VALGCPGPNQAKACRPAATGERGRRAAGLAQLEQLAGKPGGRALISLGFFGS
jgi:hypothetical protein